MRMKFLESLGKMPVAEAADAVKAAGFEAAIMPEGAELQFAIAIPDTVVIWQQDGLVKLATAGDPLQLTEG